jgi:ribosomal protection tetracycline resistance protein
LLRRTLNLGILAHVDAGKTTLTERLLYEAGVISELGSVDAGTTQTDSLALEQERGITIKAAVVSFPIRDVTVNLIDTPGHPDFIAEVERVLSVLDGAVLVISAVEGVQPQTRLLMRALKRLGIPTLLFVNKIDRTGAGYDRLLQAISERLAPTAVAVGTVDGVGTRAARFALWGADDTAFRTRLVEILAEQDDSILAAYVEDDKIPYRRLREEFATQTGKALVHPVFFGSAITGAGMAPLMTGLVELLPTATGDADGPVSASVFKVERGAGGDKIAYARLFSGLIQVRDRLRFRRAGHDKEREARVTAISVFDAGAAVRNDSVAAGQIGNLWGLGDIQIGDWIGDVPTPALGHQFPPPTLASVVVPRSPDDGANLRVALRQLAEQDPLINVRQDDSRHELSVSLYGEVQKEVIQATLANHYGIEVTFRETTPICIERPAGTGEAVEILHAESNPFLATVGLRIEPGPDGSGIEFRLEVNHRSVPMYVFKRLEDFADAMEQYVRQTLQEGLFGWQVSDCIVTMTESNYSSPDGPPATRGPLSTAADFRRLTPLVLMQALKRAGAVVCEPTVRVSLEIPTELIAATMSALARLSAAIEPPSLQGKLSIIKAVLPAAQADELQRQLPGLTGGEGVLESSFAGYQPASGDPPSRRRTLPNPLNFNEYMMHLNRRVPSSLTARREEA